MSSNIKTILVTGGTRGLGLAIVKRLSAEKYHVVASGRAISTDLEMLMSGRNIHFEPLDLSDHSAIHEFVKKITSTYGPIYGLVNNAALGHDGVLA